jgi:hypothetical protein
VAGNLAQGSKPALQGMVNDHSANAGKVAPPAGSTQISADGQQCA